MADETKNNTPADAGTTIQSYKDMDILRAIANPKRIDYLVDLCYNTIESIT